MRAILLAAGRGRRLGSAEPKCLISIDDRTLLERHLANMSEAGISALTLVVGFEKERILAALAGLYPAFPVEVVENPRFVHGSIVSLQVAGERLLEGAVWMDADVLYPAALLARLVASPHANAVLLDGRSEESGEEMMVGVLAGRAVKIARRVGAGPSCGTPESVPRPGHDGGRPPKPPGPAGPEASSRWDFAGESVGFTKVGPAGGRAMKRILDDEVAAGRLDQEYEAAMERAFAEVPFGFERVDDFAWTEIDFEEDVVKARELARAL